MFTVWFVRYIYRTYDDKGKCTPIGGAHRSASLRTHNLQKPSRLYWDMTPKLAEIVENAVKFAQRVNGLIVLLLSLYGYAKFQCSSLFHLEVRYFWVVVKLLTIIYADGSS